MKKYSEDEVQAETMKYFDNDELATNVWMNKYALRDNDNNLLEKTPDDMHKRLAKEFKRIEEKYPNSLSYDEIYENLKEFKYIVPAGSVLYGVGNNYTFSSLSNCIVISSPKDSISGIFDDAKEAANLFKQRAGVGLDISSLRPYNMKVNNSAKTSTGAFSFVDFYSYTCGMICQESRRGALLISMDINHPDIEKFIVLKTDFKKATSANLSVKITDKFMDAVKNNKKFILQFPTNSENPESIKEIEAKDLWNLLIKTATLTAEPGIILFDNICKNLPAHCYPHYTTCTTNPCSELPLSTYDSCRLININLKSFVINPFEDNCYFNFDKFKEIIKIISKLADDIIDLEIEKINEIINKTNEKDEKELWNKLLESAKEGRRVGIGSFGIADVFACMKIKYDSDKAEDLSKQIYNILRNEVYNNSMELAKERGSFSCFNWELEKENEFIKRLPKDIQNALQKHGRRNISLLTIPPTGSISILAKTSSGIEPVFRNSYKRRRKLSHNEKDVNPDFIDAAGNSFKEYELEHHNILDYRKKFPNEKDLPNYFIESNNIDPEKRVLLQGEIQQFIDHSISSTINLPKGTSSEIVGKLYMMAWEKGLKGLTVYVDGSRDGILLTNDNKQNKKEFIQNNAPKRLKELECDIHHINVHEKSWIVLIGLFENKPYEIFAGESERIVLPKKYKKGVIVKEKTKNNNSLYNLVIKESNDEEDNLIIKDLVNIFNNDTNGAFTRLLSTALRHGTPVKFVVEQIKKNKSEDMFSFSKVIARVLKKYIIDGEKSCSDKLCPECKMESIIYKDGCIICSQCGYSKCN